MCLMKSLSSLNLAPSSPSEFTVGVTNFPRVFNVARLIDMLHCCNICITVSAGPF